MNHPKSPNSQLLQFMLRAQQLARQDVKTDKGYAMMMTSIITIMLFSLMGAFLTMTNLAKSSTDAYIDGNNTFYASEAALNQRAQELRARFENYNSPSDGATNKAQKDETEAQAIAATPKTVPRKPTAMSSCYLNDLTARKDLPTPQLPSDFECRNYEYKYNNNIARTAGASGNSIVLSEADGNSSQVKYQAYTFVSDKTNYDLTSSAREPIPTVIDGGTYGGLNAQEYKYTVNATATKPNANVTGSQIGQSGDNKTVLQMDFKSRTIPLFQFGAFYQEDLELNPSPTMTFNGRLHSNKKVYLTAGDRNLKTLSLNGIVSAVTSINTGNPALPNGYAASGTVKIQTDPAIATSFVNLPETSAPQTAVPVLATTFIQSQRDTVKTTYNDKLKIAATALTPPPIGFLTKVDASKPDRIGEYYGKADLRLEMFPDRSVPFELQVVKSGGTTPNTTCAATPFSTTVSKERADYNKADCAKLSEGQLRSLMQPVLVRPRTTIEYTTFCTTPLGEVRTPPQVGTAPNIGTTDIKDSTDPIKLAIKERILDALYLTLSAQTTTASYSTLASPLSTNAQNQFKALLTIINIPGITTSELDTLVGQAPRDIAALSSTTTNGNATKGSCFRPAPIQALFNPTSFNSTTLLLDTATNFFDRREKRYIRMLQTNIESLTLWNRDGLFTQPTSATDKKGTFDGDLTSADAITDANLASTFNIDSTTKQWGNLGKSSADGVLFKRAAPVTTALVYNPTSKVYEDKPLPTNSFRTMELAASDRTEGGLVIHATIAIDKTTTYPYTYTANTTYPYLTNPTTPIIRDSTASVRQSPYGFAFNDGANLPAPLTIATDQAVYSQGDWNTVDKQPASFLADTIAVLSNSCLNVGQLNCGVTAGRPPAATATTINAAFLSRTDLSDGSSYYSGGLNNYMRILENWTNQAMNYTGSFVSLGKPREVSGEYKPCNALTPTANYGCPPDRNWQYDTSFNSYSGLPPLPPKVTELQQDSFRRKFN